VKVSGLAGPASQPASGGDPSCCGNCGGEAWCSPNSGSCYTWKKRDYYEVVAALPAVVRAFAHHRAVVATTHWRNLTTEIAPPRSKVSACPDMMANQFIGVNALLILNACELIDLAGIIRQYNSAPGSRY